MIRKTTGTESGSITTSPGPARRPAARAAGAGHFSAARPGPDPRSGVVAGACVLARAHAGGAQASAVMAGSGSYLALVELARLDDRHQVVGMLQHGDVGKRIAVDDEHVCPLSGFDGACLGPDAK
jgi:hypothetical protein